MCRVKKLDATKRYFWMTLPLYYDWPYWSLEWTRDTDGSIIITRWNQVCQEKQQWMH